MKQNVSLALIHMWFILGGNERKTYFQSLCSMSVKTFLLRLTFKLSYAVLSEASLFHSCGDSSVNEKRDGSQSIQS